MRPVWEVLHPYPEVAEGRVTEDSFVVNIGGIWEHLELGQRIEVDPRYLDPEGFYRRTHFTDAMKRLLRDIIKRLRGEAAQSIYHLQVGMGGGKSHTLLLLYFLSRYRDRVLPYLRREGIAEEVPNFKVAILDGMRISLTYGIEFPDGTRVRTLWGLLFKQLGVYERFKEVDRLEEGPSVPMLKEAFARGPTLILIDEITTYVANTLSQRRLTDRVQAFLHTLTTAVKETPGCALVATTAIGIYPEALKLVSEILSRYCSPTIIAAAKEYKSIRRRALYTDDFDPLAGEIEELARMYESCYKTYLPGRAAAAVESILDNYPLHPFVDRTLQRLKGHPAFQEVRDELRFLAGLIYSVHRTKDPDATLISVGHASLEDNYVRGGTISKLKDPLLVARLDTELEERLREVPEEIKGTARRLLSTIVLNSLYSERPTEAGVTEEEAKYALLTPETSPILIEQALKEIMKKLWFINYVNERYVFGQPNVSKLIGDYTRKVEKDRALRGLWWDKISGELRRWRDEAVKRYIKQAKDKGKTPLFNQGEILVWVNRSDEIPDDKSMKLIFTDYTLPPSSILPREALSPEELTVQLRVRTASTHIEACEAVKDLYENYGQMPREYKNTVYFLVAGRDLVGKNGPVGQAKQLMALEEMMKDRDKLRALIGETGLNIIERLKAETLKDLLPTCVRVFRFLVYPSEAGLASIQLGEERMDVEGLLTLIEEKLRTQARKVVERIDAATLLDRYWPKAKDRAELREIINGFYRRPEIEMITDRSTVEEAIREALREGLAAYSYGGEVFYRREPSRLNDDGVLVKNPDLAEVSIEAFNQAGEPQSIKVRIDGREERQAPIKMIDLKGASHRLRPLLPEGVIFQSWSDGVIEEEREVIWDKSKSLAFTCRTEVPPQVEVELTVRAQDIESHEQLEVIALIDGLTYKTPITNPVSKGRRCIVRVETPRQMVFEGWSDGIPSAEREILCDIDQVITAKFRPVKPGQEIIEDSGPIQEMAAELERMASKMTRSIRLELSLSYADLLRHIGALMQLLPHPFTVKVNASGGKAIGFETLTFTASSSSERQGELRACLTQLRDYLETADLTLIKEIGDFKPLEDVISGDALRAMGKIDGSMSLRIVALAEPREEKPTRTIERLLTEFKRRV